MGRWPALLATDAQVTLLCRSSFLPAWLGQAARRPELSRHWCASKACLRPGHSSESHSDWHFLLPGRKGERESRVPARARPKTRTPVREEMGEGETQGF